jgi:hypothetical protein
MRRRILVGALICFALLAVSVLSATPVRRAAVVRFLKPTIIAGTPVIGTVVFEHDDARMARGEACTKVYFFDARNQTAGDLIVAFHCTPKDRDAVKQFEARVIKLPQGPDRLIEYQMAGETEAHGVPY